jgi:hypothetical protein
VTRRWEILFTMGRIADSKPTAELSPETIKELSPEIIKTICDTISQEFYRWELKEDKDEEEE